MSESSTRVEAFSDGVFAIAITLLILEIKVPHGIDHGELWAGLRALWPSFVAFFLSFFVILIMWVNHHELLRLVRGVGYPFFFANGFVLLTVTFVPFPTAVLAEYLGTPQARKRGGVLLGDIRHQQHRLGPAVHDDRARPVAASRCGCRGRGPHPTRVYERPAGVRALHRRGALSAHDRTAAQRVAVGAMGPALLSHDG